MKSYIQKLEATSRVIEAKPKVSRQADIKEILRTYNPNPVQKRDVVPMPARQQGECGVLQRNMIQEVKDSLDIPVYQKDGPKTCWFLSILYGIHQAGWVKDLFVNKVIVTKTGENQYHCVEGGRTIDVVYAVDGRPLWQQILEGFINHDISDPDLVLPDYFRALGPPLFDKLKSVGLGGIQRTSLKEAIQFLLGTIYKGWEIQDAQIKMPAAAAAEQSPFKKMAGKPYLTPFQEADQEILEVMTVEKTGHAMGVKAATFDEQELPNAQQSVLARQGAEPKKTGVKISGLEVFNQSYVEEHAPNDINVPIAFKGKNTQKFKGITPGMTGNLPAIGVDIPEWAKPEVPQNQLSYINYYRLARAKPSVVGTGNVSAHVPELMPEHAPEHAPEHVPEFVSEHVPDYVPK